MTQIAGEGKGKGRLVERDWDEEGTSRLDLKRRHAEVEGGAAEGEPAQKLRKLNGWTSYLRPSQVVAEAKAALATWQAFKERIRLCWNRLMPEGEDMDYTDLVFLGERSVWDPESLPQSRLTPGERPMVYIYRGSSEDSKLSVVPISKCVRCGTLQEVSSMARCPANHLQCRECVTRHFSVYLFDEEPRLPCMSTTGCELDLEPSHLSTLLPAPLLIPLFHLTRRRKMHDASVNSRNSDGRYQRSNCDPGSSRISVMEVEDCH